MSDYNAVIKAVDALNEVLSDYQLKNDGIKIRAFMVKESSDVPSQLLVDAYEHRHIWKAGGVLPCKGPAEKGIDLPERG